MAASDDMAPDVTDRQAPSSGRKTRDEASPVAAIPCARSAPRDADTIAKYRAGQTISFDELKRRVCSRAEPGYMAERRVSPEPKSH
jgi:hypothetical protein